MASLIKKILIAGIAILLLLVVLLLIGVIPNPFEPKQISIDVNNVVFMRMLL